MNLPMEYVGLGTRVLMGPGTVDRVADEVRLLGGSRVMLITGRRTGQTKLVARAVAALGPLLVDTFGEVVEHSGTKIVADAARRAAEQRIDLLLAIGGGSPSDTAKATAILLAEGGPLHSHANRFTPPDKLVQQQLNQPKLPILAIPTTASAGEVTPGLGIRDDDGHKLLFWDTKVAARTIILDPEANVEIPAPILTGSGMNGLAHCVEGLYSKKRNPVADGFAQQGIRLLSRGLRAMVKAPASVEARADVLYGAFASGLTIASTRTCLHHGICHCLGALGGLSHATANSIMLPHAMRFNARVAAPQLRLAAQAMGVEVASLSDADAASRAVEAVVRLQRDIGVPMRLRDTILKRELLPAVAAHAMGDRALYFNPGPTPTQADVLGVLEAAW
jgi:alcohol dehydrogenase class IV